jgi:hypothetical protein
MAIKNNSQAPYLPIFTTNYDLLFEDLFSEFGDSSKFTPKLVNGIPNCTKDGSIWCEEEYKVQPAGIHLYRLHGCVSWFWHPSEKNVVQYSRSDTLQHPLANLCAIYPGSEVSLGLNPHVFGFRKLNELLLSCKIVVFIGFSFRDNDVIHILLSANARREQSLKLVVVDPTLTSGSVIERLSNSSLETQHPIRLPETGDIHCINIRYGIDNFSQDISNVIDQLLKDGGGSRGQKKHINRITTSTSQDLL